MTAAKTHDSTEDLQRLTELTQAQFEAARAGDLEGLEALLDLRQGVLDRLRGRHAPPGGLKELFLRDTETRVLLEARIRSVTLALARLRKGEQALTGYAPPVVPLPGFVDQLR